jgi:hypothetical protein
MGESSRLYTKEIRVGEVVELVELVEPSFLSIVSTSASPFPY